MAHRLRTALAAIALVLASGLCLAQAVTDLPSLLSRALARDPQVRLAESLLEIARGRQSQARSRLGPAVIANLSRGNAREVEFGRLIERRTERAEVGVRWNLYNYGDDAAEWRGSQRDVEAATHELRRAREEVAERIASAYADLLRVDALVPAAQERLQAVQRLVAQVRQQADAGKASEADAQQARVSLLDAQIVAEQLLQDREAAQRRLVILVGEEVGALQPPALPEQDEADGAAQPGVVAAARLRAEAARERVRPVASSFTPRIDLEFRQRLSDRTTPQLTTEQQNGWLLTARWELPVGGELQSRRVETQRRAEAAEAEADRLLRGVQAEMVTLAPRIASSERAVAQLDAALDQHDALLRAAALQFDAGRRTLAQLLQLHDSRYNARQRRVEQAHLLLTASLRRLALNGALLEALGQGGG